MATASNRNAKPPRKFDLVDERDRRQRVSPSAADDAYKLYSEARTAMEAKDLGLALEKLRSASALAPHYKTYELLGECLLQQGEAAEAVLYLSAAAGLGNKQTRSRYLLAQALIRLDPTREADAVEKLREALELNPQYKAAKQLLEDITRQRPEQSPPGAPSAS
jgi:tetratricopeptide (TPR) repeat protein